ncbi:1674_t:CDS:2 [Ambispora leptoticha]|uniref:1674_t:CDS:1 n=1 Tax=Ambispora leptoticha TaxID=144679 RepID=A0A9N8YNZ8_9GLOM|nr:1674_t:CDS:2 [Ambispora leptoticha]
MKRNSESYKIQKQAHRQQLKELALENFKAKYKAAVHCLLRDGLSSAKELPYGLTISDLENLLDFGKRITGNDDKLPRPQNSWIIYRKFMGRRIIESKEAVLFTDITKLAGERWQKESEEVRQLFFILAEANKRAHKFAFPNYRYKPTHKTIGKGNEAKYKLIMDKRVTSYVTNRTTSTTNDTDKNKPIEQINPPFLLELSNFVVPSHLNENTIDNSNKNVLCEQIQNTASSQFLWDLSTPIVPSQHEEPFVQEDPTSSLVNLDYQIRSELNLLPIYESNNNMIINEPILDIPAESSSFHSAIFQKPEQNLMEFNYYDALNFFPEDIRQDEINMESETPEIRCVDFTFRQYSDIDVLFIPDTIPKVDYVLSVCTGSALIAATGPLDGKSATIAYRWLPNKSDGLMMKTPFFCVR